jgi:hypothetical protein
MTFKYKHFEKVEEFFDNEHPGAWFGIVEVARGCRMTTADAKRVLHRMAELGTLEMQGWGRDATFNKKGA